MWASKGGLTHDGIMGLTWRQFHVYLDAFTWLMNEQSEDGQKKNRRYDLEARAQETRCKAWKTSLVEETKEMVAKHKERAVQKMKAAGVKIR